MKLFLEFKTYRATGCSYPLDKADGYFKYIQTEEECMRVCDLTHVTVTTHEYPCRHFVYNPEDQTCYLFNRIDDDGWNGLSDCNRVVGPATSLKLAEVCIQET